MKKFLFLNEKTDEEEEVKNTKDDESVNKDKDDVKKDKETIDKEENDKDLNTKEKNDKDLNAKEEKPEEKDASEDKPEDDTEDSDEEENSGEYKPEDDTEGVSNPEDEAPREIDLREKKIRQELFFIFKNISNSVEELTNLIKENYNTIRNKLGDKAYNIFLESLTRTREDIDFLFLYKFRKASINDLNILASSFFAKINFIKELLKDIGDEK